jgi:decaprenylphospho-beta-D-erythro-pentofuranosid-2-ulose 2-reductase
MRPLPSGAGTLPDQAACAQRTDLAEAALLTNFTSTALLSLAVAAQLEKQASGCLAVISSVAGDRGRQSNYVYGAAKAGVTTLLAGLRNRLHRQGVRVLTIKPGFVDTPMTSDFRKGPLWASPGTVAGRIVRAIDAGAPDVLYVPGFWRLIMLVIQHIPEWLFKRLKL